ncbi:MAG: hypothetical protein ABF968_09485 [Acetobacter sp.]|uniref:Lipoprotein n=2 Tax=Acetobacter TaxID=434 RepID=A0A6S6PV79_ACEAC|nr:MULTISPECIES: hypothetical protein [Acetobacter]MCE0744689.1 hypothetical protein [Acetobacter sicerae]BCI68552.1 hypothetical protein AAJCM20276_31760 [Acetobacter aceti]
MKRNILILTAFGILLAACCPKPDPNNSPVDGSISCNFDHLPGEKTTCPLHH